MRVPSRHLALIMACALGASGCRPTPETPAAAVPESEPAWVLTVPIEAARGEDWCLTGTLRARHEIPLAFRLGGEIRARRVDAGDRVERGQVLFELDDTDLVQERISAEAAVASARAEDENAARERDRLAGLLTRRLASQQDADRAVTAARAARERLKSAEAALERARSAVGYAALSAPKSGVILEATGQPGQVVSAGQAVARLAQEGPREAEVDVPEDLRERLAGTALVRPLGGGPALAATLREIAGAADPLTRTWRARYRLDDAPAGLSLGTTLTLCQAQAAPGAGSGALVRVPVGAILERAQGAQVWRVVDGRVRPEPVTLIRLLGEYAEVSTALTPGTQIVALGVSRLHEGQAVRARTR